MPAAHSSLTIFYLSGTGNALRASHRIAEEAERLHIPVELISIDRLHKVPLEKIQQSSLIGLCYPTHGFSLPWLALRFILKMPAAKNKDFFLLNTRAGSKIGPLFLPGISGLAQWLPLFILWLKGWHCKGLFPLDMPSNWISLHPGFTTKTVHAITNHCMKQTERFAAKILSGRSVYRPVTFILIPIDIILIPVAIGYTIFGRFFIAKTFIADYTCTNCGLCIQNCPSEAIIKKFGRPYWTFDCESCMRCMNTCPERSIQTAHGYIAMLVFALLYIPFFAWASGYLLNFIVTGFGPLDTLLDMIVFTALALPFVYITYFVMAYVQQFKISSLIFRNTSLTRYWKHYIAPGIKAASFKKDRFP